MSLRDEPFDAVLETWEAEGPVDGAAPCVPCGLLPGDEPLDPEPRPPDDPGDVPAFAGRFDAPLPACDDADDPVAWLDELPGRTNPLQYVETVSPFAAAAFSKLANATEEPVLEEPLLEEPLLEEPVLDDPVLDDPLLEEPWCDARYAVHRPYVSGPPIFGPTPLAEPVVDVVVAWSAFGPLPGIDTPTWDTASATVCCTPAGREPVAAAATPPPTRTKPVATAATLAVISLAIIGRLLVGEREETRSDPAVAATMAATTCS